MRHTGFSRILHPWSLISPAPTEVRPGRTARVRATLASALAAVLLVAGMTAPLPAQDDGRNTLVVLIAHKQSNLTMIEKSSRILSFGNRIKTVDGFDPAVLKVSTISDPERPEANDPRKIRIQALAAGVTTLAIVDENNELFTIEVLVSGDTKQLEAIIKRAFPDASVQAIKVKDSVLLLGWVNQPDQLTPIVEIAEQFHPKVLNYLRVSGIQQVMLRVKIMEVQRGKIRALGFNFVNVRDGSYVSSMPGNVATLGTISMPFGGPVGMSPANLGNSTASFGLVSNDNIFQGFLEALKQESLLKVLAEPNLMTVNGRPANFLSGGEFPILVPGGLGTVTVQFKPFGVRLEFVPIVLGNGRVRLEVAPEVSEKDFTNQVTVGTTVIPGLTTRRANSQVEMNFGETLVIAGLINNRVQSRTQKVPFLGELPWVGAAFRRVSHDESETELMILVTPELAEPLSPDQVPEYGPGQNTVSPTDRELYGSGYMEVPRYGPDPDGDFQYVAPDALSPRGATPVPGALPGNVVDPAFTPDGTAVLPPVSSGPTPATGSPNLPPASEAGGAALPPPAEVAPPAGEAPEGVVVPGAEQSARRIPTGPRGATAAGSRDKAVQPAGASRPFPQTGSRKTSPPPTKMNPGDRSVSNREKLSSGRPGLISP